MTTPDRDTPHFRLSPADAELVDLVLAAMARGENLNLLPLAATERGQRVLELLELIGKFPAGHPSDDLIARTMARIAVASTPAAATQTDFDVLDSLLEASARGDLHAAKTIAHTERGKRVSHWLDLIDHLPAEPPAEDLVARTMSRIAVRSQRQDVLAKIADGRTESLELADTGTTGRLRVPAIAFRWNELIAVAAVLMIGVSLLWPVMARTRSDAMRIACAANMATAGMAMKTYAWDNNSVLPRYPTVAGSVWWNVGQPVNEAAVQSNSAHLYKLRREGYASAATLNCPTNGEAPQQLAASAFDWPNPRAVSYSYQNQYTRDPIRLGRVGSIVVLADKNPLFTPGVDSSSLTFDAEHGLDEPGRRHSQPGQNVLVIDGSVRWAQNNAINGDNFYTVQNVNTYRGTETPSNQSDSFVVP